jgi:histidyl-tRNA synthetase
VFRYEKPQKGRYRQFYQFDVEALGYSGPDVDAELIIIINRIWQALGIDAIELELNSLGTPESRARYHEVLTAYFTPLSDQLDDDSKNRLLRNPMRILDSKNPAMQQIVADAPVITDYLDAESQAHFTMLQSLLDQAGISYRLNPRLVRGLDYYTRTVFEWVTDKLGSQGAVCSGGRYDGLVEQLGGKPTPAVGWAFGLERLLELYRVSGGAAFSNDPDIYVVAVGDEVLLPAFGLVERLRDACPDLKIELNGDGGSFKSQLKRADRSGARIALIIGDTEVSEQAVGIKPLREKTDQIRVAWGELEVAVKNYFD